MFAVTFLAMFLEPIDVKMKVKSSGLEYQGGKYSGRNVTADEVENPSVTGLNTPDVYRQSLARQT